MAQCILKRMSFFDDLTSLVHEVTSVGDEFKQFTEETVSEIVGTADDLTAMTDGIVTGTQQRAEADDQLQH